MRPIAVKAYAGLHPMPPEARDAVTRVLESWHIHDAVELEGDLLRISFEGDMFPAEEVCAALRPYLTEHSRGKLDFIDLEAWTLERYLFDYGHVATRRASLNHALDACQRG